MSYRLPHAPLRFSMTLHNLQCWNIAPMNTEVTWYDMLFRHTVWAIDIVPKSERFYLTVSYNHRRQAEMNITDVRVRKMTKEGKMKAVVSITIDDEFVVHDIKIIDGQNGLFIAMPSRKISDTVFLDIVHPTNSETRKMIEEAIFAAMEKE